MKRVNKSHYAYDGAVYLECPCNKGGTPENGWRGSTIDFVVLGSVVSLPRIGDPVPTRTPHPPFLVMCVQCHQIYSVCVSPDGIRALYR